MGRATAFPGFVGPANVQVSRLSDCEFTENLYLEAIGAGAPKAQTAFYRRPSLRPYCTLGTGTVRGMFSQDGRAFGAAGPNAYEINPNKTATFLGAMVNNAEPVTIASSGTIGKQLAWTSGGEGYIYALDSGLFTPITSFTFVDHAVTIIYFGGYFLALSGVDGRFQASGLNDGFTWNALDYGFPSDFSDKVVMLTPVHDTFMLSGTRNSQIWWNNGNPSFPFAPVDGALIQGGTAAPFAVVSIANTLLWMVQDSHGGARIAKLNGSVPVTSQTASVAKDLAGHNTAQCTAIGISMRGHNWYLLNAPWLPYTWVYDVDLNFWTTWSHWNPLTGDTVRFLGTTHCFAFDKHLVGDRHSSMVYELTFDVAEDTLVTL